MTQTKTDSSILRPATLEDVDAIHVMLEASAELGELLSRPSADLYRRIQEFVVIEKNGKVIGCGALQIFTDELGEVRSLLVNPDYRGHGHGKRIVEDLIETSLKLGLKRLMALTYVPGFFHHLDFITVAKESLSEKVWGVCVKCPKFQHCDEIAVVKSLAMEDTEQTKT